MHQTNKFCRYGSKNFDEAVKFYTFVLDLPLRLPLDPMVLCNRAACHYYLGHLHLALQVRGVGVWVDGCRTVRGA